MLRKLKQLKRIFPIGIRSFSSSAISNKTFLETSDLDELLQEENENLTIVNATLVKSGYDPKVDHITQRIMGSLFFDLEALSDPKAEFPLMMPTTEQFVHHMKMLDIRIKDTIVCYDKIGMISAPRAYYMFKTFGAQNVHILNGSFSKWKQENRPTESGDSETAWRRQRVNQPKENDYAFKFNSQRVISYEKLQKIIEEQEIEQNDKFRILDGRDYSHYEQGAIPHSISLHFAKLLNKDKTFKLPEEIKKIVQEHGVNHPEYDNTIVTCQLGITACILGAALESIGNTNVQLYDGSYQEYHQKTKQ